MFVRICITVCAFACLLLAGTGFAGGDLTPTPTAYLDNDWEVMGIAQRHRQTGEIRIVPLAGLVVETPPATAPTATPTATPDITPTPTPEETVLPTLPPSTPMPPPDEFACFGASRSNMNIRAGPGISYDKVGLLPAGEKVYVLQVVYPSALSDDEWVSILRSNGERGWVAAYYSDSPYFDYETSEACYELRFPATAWGVWAGPGAFYDELTAFGETLVAAGVRPAVTVYGDGTLATSLTERGWLVAYRPFIGDCPVFTEPAWANAREWFLRALAASRTVRYSWLVVCNEPVFPSVQYAHDWIAEIVRQANAQRIPRVVPVVWATGHPEIGDILYLLDAYDSEWSKVCWGANLYPALFSTPLDALTEYTSWTTYRPLRYLHMLDVPLCVTEFARSTGGDPPVFSEYRNFVARYEGHIAWATAWYDAMPLGNWPDATLRGRLAQLAPALLAGM